MTTPMHRLPEPEDFPRLYRDLKARVERLEGNVAQLLAASTRGTILHPTWRDIQSLRHDIDALGTILKQRLP